MTPASVPVASKGILQIVFAVFLLSLTAQCHKAPANEYVLFDFENDSELDCLHWNCRALYALANEHATHGLRSLRLELYPSDYPGFKPILKKNDWRGYKRLCFDIYNPQGYSVRTAIRIDDSKEASDYYDRYNKGLALLPGMNHISIPLDSLAASGKARSLNLGTICNFLIFTLHPKEKVVLYVDYVRLTA